jgi:hypothetical protein
MKCFPIIAAAVCSVGLAACTIREERTVQAPAPVPAVVTPAPGDTVVYTQPAPATTTTTVYTNR